MYYLFRMSLAAAVIILLVTLVRAVTLRAVPKRTFLLLWLIVAIRLLIPVRPFIETDLPFVRWLSDTGISATYQPHDAVASGVSYTLPDGASDAAAVAEQDAGESAAHSEAEDRTEAQTLTPRRLRISATTVITALWAVGFTALGGFFGLSYLLGYRKFRTAENVENEQTELWLREHRLARRIQIRAMKGISSPMTYGVLCPVILVPQEWEWQLDNDTKYALEHEFVHIRRFDAALKFLLTAALTIHWFNPAVWLLYVLANRDVELSCDEAVLRRFGDMKRGGYARALLHAEEKRRELPALFAGFGTNSTKQRIWHIVRYRRCTPLRALLALTLVMLTSMMLVLSACAPRNVDIGALPGGEAIEGLPADEDAARLALTGDWVSPTENGRVYLTLSNDGTAYGYRGGKKLDRGSWRFDRAAGEIKLVTDWGGILNLAGFGDSVALVNEKYNNSRPYHTLIKAEDYQDFLDRYCTVVDLAEADPAEYFGVGAPIEHKFSYNNFGKTETRTFYSIPSTALDNGLVYLSCIGGIELTLSNGRERTVSNPYLPTDSGVNGKSVVRAAGKMIFISAEYVRSVAYSEDGNWRVITMTDGTELYEYDDLSKIVIGGRMFDAFIFAAEAGLKF